MRFLDIYLDTSIELVRRRIGVWKATQFNPEGNEKRKKFPFILCVSVMKARFSEMCYSADLYITAENVEDTKVVTRVYARKLTAAIYHCFLHRHQGMSHYRQQPSCSSYAAALHCIVMSVLFCFYYVMRTLMFCIPHTFRVIKSRRMRWGGHVARMGEKRGVYRVLVGKHEGKSPLRDPGVDGRIILRQVFRN